MHDKKKSFMKMQKCINFKILDSTQNFKFNNLNIYDVMYYRPYIYHFLMSDMLRHIFILIIYFVSNICLMYLYMCDLYKIYKLINVLSS